MGSNKGAIRFDGKVFTLLDDKPALPTKKFYLPCPWLMTGYC